MNWFRMAFMVALLQGVASQNTPPQRPAGTASVEGLVLRLGTNEPVPGADLELTSQAMAGGSVVYAAVSGVDGRFTFRNVAAGNYKLVAARIGGGYVPVEHGQRGVIGRGVVFPVADGEQKRGIRMEMAPVGTISGRILDADSRPLGHVAVMAFTAIYRNGDRLVTMMELVHSDDRGEYRLFSLTPGRYYVAARLEDSTRRTVPLGYYPPGRMFAMDRTETPIVTKRALPTGEIVEDTYQIVYFGGGANLDRATPVDVGVGAVVSGVDIGMSQARVPSRHIRGKVSASASITVPARIVAVPVRYASDMITPSGLTDSNGVFDLAGAVPGKYYLTALVPPDPNVRTNPPPQPQFGMITIEVGEGDLDGVNVSATPGFPLSGKISIENRSANDPDLARLRVDFIREPNIQGFPGLNPNSTFSPNGDFTARTLAQGGYTMLVQGLPANAYTKSIRMGPKDLLLEPLEVGSQLEGRMEVVIGTDAATLTGQVFDGRRQPSLNVKVALVPDAPLRRRWDLYKTTATDQSGRFTFRVIPPGDYKVFAWEEVEDNIWTVPEFLRNDESRGKAIHIGQSATEQLDIDVIPAPRR